MVGLAIGFVADHDARMERIRKEKRWTVWHDVFAWCIWSDVEKRIREADKAVEAYDKMVAAMKERFG